MQWFANKSITQMLEQASGLTYSSQLQYRFCSYSFKFINFSRNVDHSKENYDPEHSTRAPYDLLI